MPPDNKPRRDIDPPADIDTDIHYAFCVADSALKKFTLFQGFTPGLLEIFPAFRALAALPVDLHDPCQPKDGRIARRMAGAGTWKWMIVNASVIPELPISLEQPFWVLFSDSAETAAAVEAFAATLEIPPLHISMHDMPNVMGIAGANQAAVQQHVIATLDRLSALHPELDLEPFRALVSQWQAYETEMLGEILKSHPMTLPNQIVAESLGYEYRAEEAFEEEKEAAYLAAMAESARTILDLRDRIPPMLSEILFPRWPSLILHAPAHNRATTARPLLQRDDVHTRAVFDVQLMLQRQRSFRVPLGEDRASRIAASTVAKGALLLRRAEMMVYAHLVALRAASTVSATIRMSPAVNRVFGTVAAFGNHVRSAAQRRPARMKRLLDAIQARLVSTIGEESLALIERAGPGGIKIVSDAPVEWLPIRGLPLGIRFDTSRVGATPGNQMAIQMFLNRPIRFRPADLRRVLVVTSYEAEDKIRTLLISALWRMTEIWADTLVLEIVPAASFEELRDALDLFDGNIVIFDGHGVHPDGESSMGKLMIGGKPIDIWDRRGELNVPPIVILSACDTHGADRNHNSAANGFIACGARTVLATLLPIDARDAAEFIARLLLRLAQGIEPIISVNKRVFLWSEIIGSFLRMKMSSDVARPFLASGAISRENYDELRREANIRINLGDRDWYEWQRDEIARLSGLPLADVDAISAEAVASSDAIRYVQIGNPESIIVGVLEDLPASVQVEWAETDEPAGDVES